MSHKKSKKGSKADSFGGFAIEEPDAINSNKKDEYLDNLIKNKGADPEGQKKKKKKKKKSKGDKEEAPVDVPGASSRPDTTLETTPQQRERSSERRQSIEVRERSHSRGRSDSQRSQNRDRSSDKGERRQLSTERAPKRDRSFERPSQYQKPSKSNAPQHQKRQRNADEERARQLQAAAARPDKQLWAWETHPHLIEEIQDDLFTVSDEYSLAHCVSEDFHMGKGIAVEFKKQFAGVGQLMQQGARTGGMAFLKDRKADRFIYYLVTKARYNMKPTMMSLQSSVVAMKEHCVANGVTKLAMPAIGCGLDRLEWANVYQMLVSVFEDTGIHIKVYYLM